MDKKVMKNKVRAAEHNIEAGIFTALGSCLFMAAVAAVKKVSEKRAEKKKAKREREAEEAKVKELENEDTKTE